MQDNEIWAVNRKKTNEIFFFQNHAENVTGTLDPDLVLFSKKALYEVNSSNLHVSYNVFRYHSTLHATKTNCIKL